MRLRVLVLLALLAGPGCSTSKQSPSAVQPSQRSYHGTASVGDFLNITIDTSAKTISYTNISNGDSGVVPYPLNSTESYALNDPAGNLLAAYEIPGYAMLLEAQKTGTDHAIPALITAVAQSQITVSTFASHAYNYMQFRTSSGGFEAGSATLDAQANVSVSSYWPYGATMQGSSPFNNNTLLGANFSEDSSGTFLRMTDQGSTDYVFGTSSGIFIVDNPNGTILGLKKATTKNFDPSFAGTYKAMFY